MLFLSTILIFDFGIAQTVWYCILVLLRQCGIVFWYCSDSVVFYFGNVQTVWYFILVLLRQCGILFFIALHGKQIGRCVCLTPAFSIIFSYILTIYLTKEGCVIVYTLFCYLDQHQLIITTDTSSLIIRDEMHSIQHLTLTCRRSQGQRSVSFCGFSFLVLPHIELII